MNLVYDYGFGYRFPFYCMDGVLIEGYLGPPWGSQATVAPARVGLALGWIVS